MPKIIPEIREQFIAAARQRILYSQQHDLTIREISEDCRTGLGTVYNYFPSKDELIAEVLFEDWQTLWEEVQKKLEDSESPMQDIELILNIRRQHKNIDIQKPPAVLDAPDSALYVSFRALADK